MQIPVLAKSILDFNAGKQVGDTGYINLKGFLLGNALLSSEEEDADDIRFETVTFYADHYIYGPKIDPIAQSCANDLDRPTCQYFNRQLAQLTQQINPFNIFAECDTEVLESSKLRKSIAKRLSRYNSYFYYDQPKCLSFVELDAYFSDNFTRQALNVDIVKNPAAPQ